MYKRNTVACPGDNFCSLRAISITNSEYVLVAFVIQYVMPMRHIIVGGLPSSKIFFHIIS